jgi:tetratricopeptide (TPR) repeat protein
MALALAKDSKDPDARMLAQEKIGTYFHSLCQWDSSQKAYTKLSKLAVKYGSKRYYDQSITLLASWNYSKGNYNRQYKYAKEGYEANKKRGDFQQTALATCYLAHALISADASEEAIRLLKEERKLYLAHAEFRDSIARVCLSSLLALAYVYAKNLVPVYEIVEEAIATLNPGVQHTYYGYIGYTALIECCVVLYNSNPAEKIPLIVPYLKHLLYLLEKHSAIYPISKCGYWYWKGSFCFATQNKKEALKYWNKGLKLAENSDMPFEQALCLYALGKNDKSNYETSENYLDQSMKIFKKLGANYQLEAVKRKKREKHKFSGSLIFTNMKQHNHRKLEVILNKKPKFV